MTDTLWEIRKGVRELGILLHPPVANPNTLAYVIDTIAVFTHALVEEAETP